MESDLFEEMLAGNAYYLAPYGRYWCIKQSEYTPIDPGGSGGKVQVKVGETYTHDMRKGGFMSLYRKKRQVIISALMKM